MNARIDAQGHIIDEGQQVQIGGNERYISLCRKHFLNKQRVLSLNSHICVLTEDPDGFVISHLRLLYVQGCIRQWKLLLLQPSERL